MFDPANVLCLADRERDAHRILRSLVSASREATLDPRATVEMAFRLQDEFQKMADEERRGLGHDD